MALVILYELSSVICLAPKIDLRLYPAWLRLLPVCALSCMLQGTVGSSLPCSACAIVPIRTASRELDIACLVALVAQQPS